MWFVVKNRISMHDHQKPLGSLQLLFNFFAESFNTCQKFKHLICVIIKQCRVVNVQQITFPPVLDNFSHESFVCKYLIKEERGCIFIALLCQQHNHRIQCLCRRTLFQMYEYEAFVKYDKCFGTATSFRIFHSPFHSTDKSFSIIKETKYHRYIEFIQLFDNLYLILEVSEVGCNISIFIEFCIRAFYCCD